MVYQFTPIPVCVFVIYEFLIYRHAGIGALNRATVERDNVVLLNTHGTTACGSYLMLF